ncbi:MAG: Gamma-glutamyltranspeptidase @ Glutathione hydrolase [uncultured Thermomicrobiales bacterium]|uniref:Gamma-glutamyltranspeptidase @ Glutathione hydrolase n=1 Tax=uncultured Thermomicrobiales bacterium TaxID=1645740 RepID=A0A6J4UZB5_9BACT|nr:MAG: Gamma-glutamyltranspeptidase @ Glutathione hydrolase [uncultured Thermomicrobiales bacterium]
MAERSEWTVGRTEAAARGGMVAAKTPQAAEAGAAVLRAGGNAVDAAVATAFAAGVAEPWMNGIGGGGYLVVAGPGVAPAVVAFPMVAPRGATAGMFPLSGGAADAGLFGWPGVVADANLHGPRSVAIPGVVAGLALALERFGTRPLAEAMAPAVRLAAEGVPVTWHTTLTVARDLATLKRYPATAAVFLDGAGNPPVSPEQASPTRLRQPDLARTLETIAAEGPRAFYEGPLAEAMASHLADGGAPVVAADFAAYEAHVAEPLAVRYAGHEVVTIGGGTGGTTLAQSLLLMDAVGVGALGHNTPEALHRMAQAFRQAFADRFAWLADPAHVEVPLVTLTDAAYAAERVAEFPADRLGTVAAGSSNRVGVGHGLGPSIPGYAAAAASGGQMADGSTTHLSVIDGDGLAVSLTQTLLSGWGSRVVVPGTGVLLNNGMMWFDPEPGRPNSVAGGKTPLSNMAPALLLRDGAVVASIGSSGGRRIMNCHAQLVANLLDHGLGAGEALAAPRIDASTPELLASVRLAEATRQALAALGHRVAPRDERLFTGDFASPCAVVRGTDGSLTGAADPFYFPASAVGAG